MNNEKIMGFDHALADIDKQIEELYVKRAEVENKIEQVRKESEEKRKAERTAEFNEIETAIEKFNGKWGTKHILCDSSVLNRTTGFKNPLWDFMIGV